MDMTNQIIWNLNQRLLVHTDFKLKKFQVQSHKWPSFIPSIKIDDLHINQFIFI